MSNFTIDSTESVTPSLFTDIRPQWRQLSAERKISSADITALCLYRSVLRGEGKPGAIDRIKKAFQPITNTVKLANGAEPYFSLIESLRAAKYSVILQWLTQPEQLEIIRLSKEISVNMGEIA